MQKDIINLAESVALKYNIPVADALLIIERVLNIVQSSSK